MAQRFRVRLPLQPGELGVAHRRIAQHQGVLGVGGSFQPAGQCLEGGEEQTGAPSGLIDPGR
jgi:hypothetical protein